ncbi:acyltransferase [Patescibacteria group bacterium]|nr:acyltransferase [Patescibacteria group bacterium]
MPRNQDIDNLRGLAMLAMIVDHATAYFLKDKTAYLFWNLSEWSVVAFLFCSAYLFYTREFIFGWKNFFAYVKKRFLRLYLPYFYFLIFYFPLRYFLYSKKIGLNDVVKNIFLYGGLDLNWLVLIFFELTLVFPVVYYFWKKNKVLYYLYFFVSLGSAVYYLYLRDWNYRFVMWLPWSLVIYFVIFYIENQKRWKRLLGLGIAAAIVYYASMQLVINLGHNVTQYYNKYPPNVFHISYGVFVTLIFYFMSKMKLFKVLRLEKILFFFSFYSYPIFFIHNLVIFSLDWMNVNLINWYVFTGVIIAITSVIVLLLNARKISPGLSGSRPRQRS